MKSHIQTHKGRIQEHKTYIINTPDKLYIASDKPRTVWLSNSRKIHSYNPECKTDFKSIRNMGKDIISHICWSHYSGSSKLVKLDKSRHRFLLLNRRRGHRDRNQYRYDCQESRSRLGWQLGIRKHIG